MEKVATILVVVLLVLILLVLLALISRIDDLVRATRRNTSEVRKLRLKSRARVRQASVQSGPVSHEQQMERLGRASVGRRVVVGGDDDARQKKMLMDQVGGQE